MSRPNIPRDPIAGPDTPESPFPLFLRGTVIKGFGRGSADLGIPTANIPLSGLSIGGCSDLASGIYYGYCALDLSTVDTSATDAAAQSKNFAVADLEAHAATTTDAEPETPDEEGGKGEGGSNKVYESVLSIGYNLYYNNPTRSLEIHILATFPRDFYGATLSLVILGYIRPEYDYVSKEALVEDIREDIRVARRSLRRAGYEGWRGDKWLRGEGKGEGEAERRARERWGKGAGQNDVLAKSEMDR